MTYYKVVCGGKLIGVGTTENLIRHQEKHNLLLMASEDTAECIMINEVLYHDVWMQAFKARDYQVEEATVQALLKSDYDSLKEVIESGKELDAEAPEDTSINDQPEEPVSEEVAETPEEEVTAEYVREVKIKELSLACNKAITDGFDIELSDGAQHHFSMTLQDQANLNAASTQILNGDSEIPYHADGEDYKAFSAEDMMAVIGAANTHKIRQLSYFGCLKAWVNGLVRISSIRAVEYGSEVPQKYQSTLYKNVRGGVN